jgi:type III pantothenate kinase
MILAVNAGNTNVVFAMFDEEGQVVSREVLDADAVARRDRDLFQIPFQSAADIVVASVKYGVFDALADFCESEGILRPISIPEDVPFPIRVGVDNPRTVGVDRVLNAAAAEHLSGGPVAAVDFGTAVTVDFAADGVFLGGAILPGMRVQAKSLNHFTSKLPLVEVIGPGSAVARNTEAAISSGIFWGVVGAVKEVLARMEEDTGRRFEVFATGGDTRHFAHLVSPDCRVESDLTLLGILLAWKRERGIGEEDAGY